MKNLVGYRSVVRTVLSSKEKVLEATVSNSILDIDKKCNNEFRIFIYLSSTHVLMKTIVWIVKYFIPLTIPTFLGDDLNPHFLDNVLHSLSAGKLFTFLKVRTKP